MATARFGVLFLCVVFTGALGAHVQITDVRLTKYAKGTPSLNLGDDDLLYTLECIYNAPAGSVTKVSWELEGYDHPVYTWDAITDTVKVEEPLLGHVKSDSTTEGKAGPFIHFLKPDIRMRGTYTCLVFHTISDQKFNPVMYTFDLQMYYFDATPFQMTASLEGCNVLWSYSSNVLYPKPHVTCGFWNPEEEKSIRTIRGGLTFKQFLNGTWQVHIDKTPLQIKDIPQGSQLYCDLELPIANFTHHMLLDRNQDNELVYQEIDRSGCPLLPTNDTRLESRLQNCQKTCRGECQQLRERYPVITQFWCGSGHYAYWPTNRSSSHEWQFEVACEETERVWMEGTFRSFTPQEFPVCLNEGHQIFVSKGLALAIVMSCLWSRIFT